MGEGRGVLIPLPLIFKKSVSYIGLQLLFSDN